MFVYDSIDVLAVPLSVVDSEGEVGKVFEAGILFERATEVASVTLEKDQCISFSVSRDGGDQYPRCSKVWCDIDSGDGNERICIGFVADKGGRLLTDDLGHSVVSIAHTLSNNYIYGVYDVAWGQFSLGLNLHTKFTFFDTVSILFILLDIFDDSSADRDVTPSDAYLLCES